MNNRPIAQFVFTGLIAALLLVTTTPVEAGKLIADRADATMRTDGRVQQAGNWTVRAGENTSPSAGCVILPFQLPDISIPGKPFETASLRVQLASFSGRPQAFALDLYGLKRIADKPDVLSEDYFAGKRDASAVLIQDDYMTAATPVRSKTVPYVGTTSDADQVLATFLREQWDDGKNAGKFIFLRLSPDVYPMPKGNHAYHIVASNAAMDREKPTINFTGDGEDAANASLQIPAGSDGKLLIQSNQVHPRGFAKINQPDAQTVEMTFDNPQQGSGIRITPANYAPSWDLANWKILSVDIQNKSQSVQMRLLMEIAAKGQTKTQYSNTGIALNPGEKQTLKMLIPHDWKYDIPKDGPRGPRTVNSSQVTDVSFFVQWPFEHAKSDLVNCVISNLHVEENITPTTSLAKENFYPFIDEYGQYIHEDWPGKIHSPADLKKAHQQETKELAQAKRPAQWNKYGSWIDGPKRKATGSFRTEKVDGKWYFVDPDGYLFWSHGVDVLSRYNDGMKVDGRENWYAKVPKDTKSFYPTDGNLAIKYGTEDYHAQYYANLDRRLEHWGFNSIGNWSRHELIAQGNTPYTLQITDYSWSMPRIKGTDVKFYDVWDQRYANHIRTLIPDQIKKNPVMEKSLTDPMCIGYFIDNELNFGNRGRQVLVDGILKSPAKQAAKITFVDDLKIKYLTIDKLNDVWQTHYTDWTQMLESTDVPTSEGYRADSDVFFRKTVERYFQLNRDAIKAIAPHRLYLGCRFISTDAPRPILAQMSAKYCDVLTVNVYAHSTANFPLDDMPDMPVLIGEFHFGAKFVEGRGMFSDGLSHTGITQADRAYAYTRFVQGALVHPNIVGTHWFQYRDQPLTGRGDGEAYQIGFVDVVDTPYKEMCNASRIVGQSMYTYRAKGKLEQSMD
ncbi:MAG: beta-agarase [Phycisphaeraceae bacterium JB051]